ncbi:putative tetratricopeptide-like helical domain superfamily [Dioscorea sansibarensis]
MHGLMIKTSMDTCIVALNALMDLYCVIERLFNKAIVRDVVSWNTMIATFAKGGAPEKALVHVLVMLVWAIHILQSHQYNLSTYVHLGGLLVSFYARCWNLNSAYKIFSEIPDKNVVCWNALTSCCSYEVTGASVAHLKKMLLLQILPNEFTFSLGLKRISVIELTQIHSLITRIGHDSNKYVMSSVIASYDAHGIILNVSACDKTSVVDFLSLPRNAIAAIYNRQGRFRETKQLLSQIQN